MRQGLCDRCRSKFKIAGRHVIWILRLIPKEQSAMVTTCLVALTVLIWVHSLGKQGEAINLKHSGGGDTSGGGSFRHNVLIRDEQAQNFGENLYPVIANKMTFPRNTNKIGGHVEKISQAGGSNSGGNTFLKILRQGKVEKEISFPNAEESQAYHPKDINVHTLRQTNPKLRRTDHELRHTDQKLSLANHTAHNANSITGKTERLGKTAERARQAHTGAECVARHGDSSHRVPCSSLARPPSFSDQEATVLEANQYPFFEKLWPEIGNGHVATVVKGNSIFMNGLYNGKDRDSHRARIPSPVAVTITSITPSNVTQKFVLDTGRGAYYERYDGEGFYVELRLYAHRVVTQAIVVELIVKETANGRRDDIVVRLRVDNGTATDDITWTHVDDNGQVTMKSGHTNEPEYPSQSPVTPVAIMSSNIPNNFTLPLSLSGADVFFVTAVSTSSEKAISNWNAIMQMIMNGTVFSSHVAEWAGLWEKGRVDVEGNLTLARVNYASLYYLMSSLPLKEEPDWPFIGMAPGGLAHGARGQDYNGHVFWDQDTWMFPPILILHADISRIIIGTRIRTLNAAKLLAKSTGYKGARYPWESAFTGLETSPSKTCGDLEQHITGDVSLAFRQYLQLTNDSDFLKQGQGLDAITAMAEFWASRVILNNSKKMWEIKDVMPPDEWHYGIDNSVYTNTVAQLSLRTAVYAYNLIGRTPPSTWQQVADNMYIPFDEKRQYHPEYDGYIKGTDVKQADAVMLGFPLMSQPNSEVQKNDLEAYEEATPGGPAMTWGIFCISWLELGNKTKADQLFTRTSLNARQPFYIWTENADGTGAVNFHTGMGGYLQALIFGYGGIRIEDSRLTLNPTLPPSTTGFTLTGLDYSSNSFTLHINSSSMTLTATLLKRPMSLTLLVSGETHRLVQNIPQTYPRQKAAVFVTG